MRNTTNQNEWNYALKLVFQIFSCIRRNHQQATHLQHCTHVNHHEIKTEETTNALDCIIIRWMCIDCIFFTILVNVVYIYMQWYYYILVLMQHIIKIILYWIKKFIIWKPNQNDNNNCFSYYNVYIRNFII